MLAAADVAFEVVNVLAESTECEVLLPDVQTSRNPEALREHFLSFHATDYHPSGTLRMGAEGDEMAVVDDHCRLRGVDNLYIADASVMPTIPRANINLPTMMIGERVAEFERPAHPLGTVLPFVMRHRRRHEQLENSGPQARRDGAASLARGDDADGRILV